MKIQYDTEDDILMIEFNKGKIVRDVSLGWNVNVSMTENGVGEIVMLDAKAAGLFPLELSKELKATQGGHSFIVPTRVIQRGHKTCPP